MPARPMASTCVLAVLGLAAAVLAGAARAESSPWYLGAAQGFTHTSNVRMAADGAPEQGATVSVTTLLGGLDQTIGRQRLFGSASVRYLAYSGASELNNLGYNLNLGLDWSTVERVSGNLTLQANRRLQLAPDTLRAGLTEQKNLESTESLQGTVRVGMVTALTLEGSAGFRRLGHSLAEAAFNNLEFRQYNASAGLRWRFSGALNAGAAARHTHTTYAALGDRALGNHLDLSARWQPSGASTLNARLSYSNVNHSNDRARDYNGATGSLDWAWQPTGKLAFSTKLSRDTGSESTFIAASLPRGDASRLTTTLALNASYEATAKIKLTAGLSHASRSLSEALGQFGVAGKDRTQSLNLGASWAPTRSLLFSCDASRDARRSSSTLSLPYQVNTYGCSAQLVLQ